MEHKTQDEIRNVADVLPVQLLDRPLSKRGRLELWAKALENEGPRRLTTLIEAEYQPPADRAGLRCDGSPLSVAFNDPRLRAAGLAGDRWSDAIAFFGLSDMELHNILCSCHYGETVSAEVAAARVRCAAAYDAERQSWCGSLILATGLGAALIAIGSLVV